MAKIEITRPGERIVDDFTALVPQPTVPSTARAPDVGLVELSYVTPTELVPGPPGPPGPAGSRWYTGVGDPTIPGKLGDMYLDDVTGYIWTYNGVAWVMTGTDLSPDASELLLKIKTVDGAGSGLDADTLDGHDSTYFATDADMTAAEAAIDALEADTVNWGEIVGVPPTFPATPHTHPESEVVNLVSDLALKAPLASPTFTGDPKAPTPATSDNDTSIATTAYVKANLATIVGGAIISDTAPGSPQAGQLWYESDSGNTFIWYNDGNSSQWVQVNILPPSTTLPLTGIVQTVITADGTYTKPVGLRYLEVEIVGPGGGGGGASATSAGMYSCGGGGGAGGYGKKLFNASDVPSSVAMVIGPAGTNSVAGGTTTFGATLSVTGGLAGATGANSVNGASQGGLGGVATGFDINGVGDCGSAAFWVVAQSLALNGKGGSSPYGGGGAGGAAALNIAGNPGRGYGSGGGGAANNVGQGAGRAGGTGGSSFILLKEYF